MQRTVVAHAAHSRIIGHAIGHRRHYTVVVGREDDGWRRQMAHHRILVGEQAYQSLVLLSVLAQEVHTRALMTLALVHRDDRIEKDGEIRTTVVLAMRRHGRGQMTASREAHDTHILRIDAPYLGRVPHGADSLLGVAHRDRAVAIGHAVGEHEEGNALTVEILSPVVPLVLGSQVTIAATRTVYNGAS